MRIRPNGLLERQLWCRRVTAVAGVDEVGVGALAGPVVAVALILASYATVDGLTDSKAHAKASRGAFRGNQRIRCRYWDRADRSGGSVSAERPLGGDGGTPASGDVECDSQGSSVVALVAGLDLSLCIVDREEVIGVEGLVAEPAI
jgi:hypothetical protein